MGLGIAKPQGAVFGLWESATHYRVTDSVTLRSEVITIMGTDDQMTDPVFLKEIEQYARERIVRGWKQTDERNRQENRRPLTVTERKDLGQIMKQIKSSHDHARESLHGRYW